jgi:hypothetical protein
MTSETTEKKISLEVRHDFGNIPMDGLMPIYSGEFNENEIELIVIYVHYFLTKFPSPLDISIEALERPKENSEITDDFRAFLTDGIKQLESYTVSPEVAKQKHKNYSVCVIQEIMVKTILAKYDELNKKEIFKWQFILNISIC